VSKVTKDDMKDLESTSPPAPAPASGPNGAARSASAAPSPNHRVTLSSDRWGRLVLTDDAGREHAGVVVVRAFPLSAADKGISLCDATGRELLWFDDLAALPESLAPVIQAELARREFVPVVRRILSISSPVEPSEWEVETDRGRTRFVLKSEDEVHCLDEYRALVTDAHSIRYLIPDTRQLDANSRRLLERFL
jgi:Domain of unknown function (DUF1854)